MLNFDYCLIDDEVVWLTGKDYTFDSLNQTISFDGCTFPGTVYFPNIINTAYREGHGIDPWDAYENFTENFPEISKDVVYAGLNFTTGIKQDFSFLLDFELADIKKLVSYIADGDDFDLNYEELATWAKEYKDICPLFSEYLHYHNLFVEIKPKSKAEVANIETIVRGGFVHDVHDVRNAAFLREAGLFPLKEDTDLSAIAYFIISGKYCLKSSFLYSKFIPLKLIPKVVDDFDKEFYLKNCSPNYSIELEELLSCGVKYESLLPETWTKKEARKYINKLIANDYSNSLDSLEYFCSLEYLIDHDYPISWRRDTAPKDKRIIDWAIRHVPQMKKSKVIHGPAGMMETFHYHTIVVEMRPEMLVNGVKTSFNKILKQIEELRKQEMINSLGEDVKFRDLKCEVSGAKQILSSYELKTEGENMNHCVGCYVKSCLAGKSYIYHISSNNSFPFGSTCEICRIDGSFVCQQHFGYGNSTPSFSDKEIVDLLVDTLNQEND